MECMTRFMKEILEQSVARETEVYRRLLKTNDELKLEVAAKERQMRSIPYMVKKVFLRGEIQARLATMQHVLDMLTMVDKSITKQKNQIAVLEGKL